MSGYSPEERIRELEQMFLGGPIIANGKSFSIETLLDVLLVLYDECCNSTLRREKTVSTFIENGKGIWAFELLIKGIWASHDLMTKDGPVLDRMYGHIMNIRALNA
ncbi:hypothetical protein NPIL_250301 [Nephila pilipes]|uniref:Uncharacterized protein n=1 Tax=Nephila pilipes TaxID=299642 RepID=A0A8X6NIX7_NEPPI|nr:hypothetical protein NPIL_250301 [Nephila pilipes]